MRIRYGPVLALGLLLSLAMAGCAQDGGNNAGVASANGGDPTASASTSAQTGDHGDDGVKFSQCMRDQGMTWFPDPQPGGGLGIRVPQGTDKDKFDKAMQACKKYMPNGGEPPKLDAAAMEQARQMAKCMRENGVPNFPDPRPDGSIQIDGDKVGLGPGDPKFDAADKACSKYRPSGAARVAGKG